MSSVNSCRPTGRSSGIWRSGYQAAVTFLLLLFPLTTLHAEDAGKILREHFDALGSSKRLAEPVSLVYRGTIEHEGFSRSFTWSTQVPSIFREETSGGGIGEVLISDGKAAWSTVFNGVTIGLQGPDRDMARLMALVLSQSYLYPSESEVIWGLPSRDKAAGLWKIPIKGRNLPTGELSFKSKGWMLVKASTTSSRGSFTLSMDDFKKRDGVRFPTKVVAVVTRDGVTNTVTYSIDSVEREAVLEESLFERDSAVHRSFKMPEGITQVETPLKYFAATRHIFIQASPNGLEPAWFFLDSGAGASLLDKKLVEKLELPVIEKTLASGVGGSQMIEVHPLDKLNIGQLEIDQMVVGSVDLSQLTQIFDFPVAGILGQDLFRQLVVELRYPEDKAVIFSPDAYTDRGTADALPVDYLGRINLLVNGRTMLKAIVDTGSGSAMDLASATASKEELEPPESKRIPVSMGGVGGTTTAYQGMLRSVQFGQTVLPKVIATFHTGSSGALAGEEGMSTVGNQLLERFTVTFDMPRRQVLLEPNGWFSRPFPYNRSGLKLEVGEKLAVTEVMPGRSGQIKVGDLLIAVKIGKDWVEEPARILEQLRGAAGVDVQLKIKRKNKTLQTKITLADWL